MRQTIRDSRTRALCVVLFCTLFAAVACQGPAHKMARHHGFTSDTSTIQVVTTELGGKNVFIPSTIVVTSGHPVKLSIYNTTDVPHGFAIPGLNVAEVVPAKAEKEIDLGVLEDHQVLQIKCHLHEGQAPRPVHHVALESTHKCFNFASVFVACHGKRARHDIGQPVATKSAKTIDRSVVVLRQSLPESIMGAQKIEVVRAHREENVEVILQKR